MKYTPKILDGNVNVSTVSPWRDLAVIAGGLLVLFGLFYFALGLAVRWVAPYVPAEVERSMAGMSFAMVGSEELPDRAGEVVPVLERLLPCLGEEDRRLEYRVIVVDDEQVNAVALPGGVIAVFRGLLESVESEDELLFVLGHELGHFHSRDHLAGFGRGLVMLTASMALTGADSSATHWLMKSMEFVEGGFSRDQERAADRFAIDLVRKAGGDPRAAVTFMKRVAEKSDASLLTRWWGTHPDPEERVATFLKAMDEVKL